MHLFHFLFFSLFLSLTIAQECPVYLANENNVLIMDAEQRGPGGGWEYANTHPGYGGSGYLIYKPESNFGGSEPKPQTLSDERIKTYYFRVQTPGQYRVVLRTAAKHPTEHNDVFMALPESGALKRRFDVETDLTWPADTSGDWFSEANWFKVYQNEGGMNWHVGGGTVDHEGHVIVTRWLDVGRWYTVRICGRSTQFLMDRITLYRCEGTDCNDRSNAFNAAVYNEQIPQSTCQDF